jgi:acetyltransferase-like isoleucine patch superfamily enzyme
MNKVSIGDNAIVGLSAVVIKSVSAHAVVVGNPAKELNPVRD